MPVPYNARGAVRSRMADQVNGPARHCVELHLEGTRSAVFWHAPGPHTPPPRVVLYADKCWTFYRFCNPRVPEHRAATYRQCEPLRLAPGEYKGK